MPKNYKVLKINALRERGRRMASARWKKDRARRDAEMPERMAELREIEIQNLPHHSGDILGVMQWTDARSGQTRRWIVRIGDRRDQITISAPGGSITKSHGWAWFLSNLRKKICHQSP
jgi:hypothetical protein